MIHRYLAGTLGLLILTLAVLAWRWRGEPGQQKWLPTILVGLVAFQSLLGMWTVTLLLKPLIVTAHLFGGMATLALLWWCLLRQGGHLRGLAAAPSLRAAAVVALVVLVGQIFLGAWTSSHYAALACPDFPTCHNQWWPETDFASAFTLWQGLGTNYEYGVLGFGAARDHSLDPSSRRGGNGDGAAIAGVTSLDRGPRGSALADAGVAVGGLCGFTARPGHRHGGRASAVTRGGGAQRRRGLAIIGGYDDLSRRIFDPLAGPAMSARPMDLALPRLSRRLGDYYELCKPRVVLLIVFTAMVGMFLATPGIVAWQPLVFGTVGIGLMAASAAALNQILDRAADARMARTRRRPLVLGHLAVFESSVFAFAFGALGMAVLYWLVNPLTAWLTLVTLVGYAGVYTLYLKRATPQNIVIGGAAGAAPPVLGWAAVTGTIHPHALLLFLIVFVWTPPHFWALAIERHREYAEVDIPMLPVTHGLDYTRTQVLLYTVLMVLVTLLPFVVGMSGWLYLLGALVLGGRFLYFAVRAQVRAPAWPGHEDLRLFHRLFDGYFRAAVGRSLHPPAGRLVVLTPPGTARPPPASFDAVYVAASGYEADLQAELRHRGAVVAATMDRLVFAYGLAGPAAWAQNTWLDPRELTAPSITAAARQLRAMQRNWHLHSVSHHRRARLIADRLPPIRFRPLVFPADPPAAPLGAWTLLGPDRLVAAQASSPFPDGEAAFVEDRSGPPNRAYLKLWEALTLARCRPAPGQRCLDLGAAPGGWTWVLARLGAQVLSIDRAHLAPAVTAWPGVTHRRGDAFRVVAEEVGSVDWIVSDLVAYPGRILALAEYWAQARPDAALCFTVKFQGASDLAVLDQFLAIPNSGLLHLAHNKRELTWLRLPAGPPPEARTAL